MSSLDPVASLLRRPDAGWSLTVYPGAREAGGGFLSSQRPARVWGCGGAGAGLWEIVEPLVPGFEVRPQGGGTAPADDRAVFTAIVFVLTSGCAWRYLPPSFGVTVPTAHRRFAAWTKAGLWQKLHRAVLDRLGGSGDLDWSSAILDAASVRAKKGDL